MSDRDGSDEGSDESEARAETEPVLDGQPVYGSEGQPSDENADYETDRRLLSGEDD